MASSNRRKFERIRLSQPVQGAVGSQSVVVRDLSILGCGLEHHLPLEVGSKVKLVFPWQGASILIESSVIRCKLERSLGDHDLNVYKSGLRFHATAGEPIGILRDMIVSQVSRALDAQKANARGDIPRYLQKMAIFQRSEEHTSELQSPCNLVCRLLLEKKNSIKLI